MEAENRELVLENQRSVSTSTVGCQTLYGEWLISAAVLLQRSHLQKYRDRVSMLQQLRPQSSHAIVLQFERMKVSSRAKKEAKMTTGGIQRTSELPTLGEEGE